MTLLEPIGALLLAHMVADYPLQIDWMAENKHEELFALLTHASTHGILAAGALFAVVGFSPTTLATAWAVAFIHAVVDAFGLHIRWDQTAHLLTCVVLGSVVMLL